MHTQHSGKDRGKEERGKSSIFLLRKLNNWVKAVSIQMFTSPQSTILDFGGGKGGDFLKWNSVNAKEVVMCDAANTSVKDAAERYQKFINERKVSYPLTLVSCDAFGHDLSALLEDDIFFDAVSAYVFFIGYILSFHIKLRENVCVYVCVCVCVTCLII